MSKKLRTQLMAALGKRYVDCTLDNFVVSNDKQRIVVETIREQVAGDLKGFVDAGRGLMLYGPPGTGKDHLLAALLISASDAQLQVRFVSGYQLFEDGKDDDLFGRFEGEMCLPDRSKCHVLGISDPVISNGKALAWSREMLLRLVDTRYRRGLSTWVTLNCKGRNEAIEMLGARTFDRLRENAVCLACDWPSYRTKDYEASKSRSN